MKTSSFMAITFGLILILSACSTATQAPPTQAVNPPPQQTLSYPAPDQTPAYPAPYVYSTTDSSYPSPNTQASINPVPTYTTNPQMGNVTGKILRKDTAIKYINLYLANVIQDEAGKDIVAGLDRVNSPSTVTDQNGSFAFINVEAGRYALILDIVSNQFLLNYPDNDQPIIIVVEKGKEVSLGDLNYSSLPLP